MGEYGGDCRHAGAAVFVAANAVKPWQYCMWRLSDGSDKSDKSDKSDGYCRLLLQYCVWASGHYPARCSPEQRSCTSHLHPPQADFTQSALLTATV